MRLKDLGGNIKGGKDSDPTFSAFMRIARKSNLAPAEILKEISKAENGFAKALRYYRMRSEGTMSRYTKTYNSREAS